MSTSTVRLGIIGIGAIGGRDRCGRGRRRVRRDATCHARCARRTGAGGRNGGTDRLVGPLHAVHAELEHREVAASETGAYGFMEAAGEIPVQMSGVVGAAGTERYEWVLHGTRQSYRLSAWRDLFVEQGAGWRPVELTGELGPERARLALFAQSIRGEHPHDLADFAAGERVRRDVEAFYG